MELWLLRLSSKIKTNPYFRFDRSWMKPRILQVMPLNLRRDIQDWTFSLALVSRFKGCASWRHWVAYTSEVRQGKAPVVLRGCIDNCRVYVLFWFVCGRQYVLHLSRNNPCLQVSTIEHQTYCRERTVSESAIDLTLLGCFSLWRQTVPFYFACTIWIIDVKSIIWN